MNCIRPGSIKKITQVTENSRLFLQAENINCFIAVCQQIGIPEGVMFSTPDLFEERDINNVVRKLNFFFGSLPNVN
jgi:hypothetical protein